MVENLLIDKCKNGDGEAYRKLIKIYQAKLFGYLLRFSNSEDEAEELFQETLIKVWSGIKKYNDQRKFASWLFTIAHNTAMDKMRIKVKNKNILPIEEVDEHSLTLLPDEQIIQQETLEQINRSIINLSEKQRAVFLLRQHGELSFKEIAIVTKEPINTVLSHMRYAIKKIKKQIEYENEPRKKSVV